jgi:multiple sugar transport system substrate-binding protein
MKIVKKTLSKFYFSLLIIIGFALITFIFLSLIGEGFLLKEDKETKIYFVDNISEGHKIVIDKFNKHYEGKIKVVPIDLPFEKFSTNERKELLIRYLRSKSDRIDIFSVDQIWTQRFAKFVEPLGSYFPIHKRENYLDAAIESCYYKDQLVALPLYFDISVLYYNDKILKSLPFYEKIKNDLDNFITWEKLIRYGLQLKPFNNSFYIFPGAEYEGLMCSYIELLNSQSSNMIKNDSVKLTTNESIKSLQLLVDLVNKYNLSPVELTGYRETDSYNHFILQKGIFLRGWPSFYNWFETNKKGNNPEEIYKLAPLPHFEGAKPVSVIGGWNLMISAASKKKWAALEFLKYVNEYQSQSLLYQYSGYLPVLKSFYEKNDLSKDPKLLFYRKIIDTYTHRPYSENYTRYSDIIAHYLNLALKKKLSVKEALSQAEQIINSKQIFIK